MSKLNEVVCKVMQLELTPSQLNYYSILSLPNFCDDRNEIAAALQAAVNQLRSVAASTSPEDLASVKRVLQQCNSVLLNKEKKSQYDNLLNSQINASKPVGNAQAKAERSSPTTTRVENKPAELPAEPAFVASTAVANNLDSILPTGDPHAAFSMREFLSSADPTLPTETPESRLEQLRQLQDGISNPRNTSNAIPQYHAQSTTAPESARSVGTNIQQRVRRKKAIRNSLTLGTLSLISIVLVGFAIYQFLQLNKSKGQTANNRPQINATNPVRSTDDLVTNEPTSQASTDTPKNATAAASSATSLELPEIGSGIAGDASGKFFTDSATPAAPSDMAAKEPMSNATAPFDMVQWQTLVQMARQSIVAKDFDAFNKHVNEMFNVQGLKPEHQELRIRIDRTGQLYKIASESFEASVDKLGSGEAIPLTDTDVINFIENKGGSLVFRIKGKNQTFETSQLPVNIVVALLDLGLDKEVAIDLAARGVFLKLYSSEAAFQAQGAEFLARAAADDEKFNQLDEFSAYAQ